MNGSLPCCILVEREFFAFFEELEYENLPAFCDACQCIGRSTANCRRKGANDGQNNDSVVDKEKKFQSGRVVSKYVPKQKDAIIGEGNKDKNVDDAFE